MFLCVIDGSAQPETMRRLFGFAWYFLFLDVNYIIILHSLTTMRPARLSLAPCDGSVYTLDTVEEHSDRSLLISPITPDYGATFPRSSSSPSSRKIIFNAMLKMTCIFLLSTTALGGTLWLALPTLEP